jgi:UDP-N-acetylmuramyl pentapeptide phosphotransferase/UDP-N-acetylglucosamine-1-phosphate transferase
MMMQVSRIALLAPVLAFGSSVALIGLTRSGFVRGLLLDRPNERSLHAAPVPRTGGLGLVPGALLGMLAVGSAGWAALFALALMLLSLLDDWQGLSAGVRLPLHLAATAGFTLLVLPSQGWTSVVVLAVAIGWMTNLYNFMDGSDGLAGGMALIGFGVYALGAAVAGAADFALVNLCVAAAAAGFLLFNFPPARVFMGDAGSIPLGFLAGALGLQGWSQGLWPPWFPLAAFAPFIADASVTLLRRALRRERVWQAHRGHYYQRIILLGWSHRRTALAEYALMAASGLVAVAVAKQTAGVQLLALTVLAGIYVLAARAVDVRWRRRTLA